MHKDLLEQTQQADFYTILRILYLAGMEENYNSILASFLFILCVNSTADSHAGIYKHVDENGRVTYSNKITKGANKLKIEPSIPRTGRDGTELSKSFPNVSENTQKTRDLRRRQILEHELATEKKLLTKAKQSLINVQKQSNFIETSIIHSQPDVVNYKDQLKNQVLRHERNITALRKELAKL